MSTEVANLDGDLINLLTTTKIATINAKKTDTAIAIALSQKNATIERLVDNDPKTVSDICSKYTDGGDSKEVPAFDIQELLKAKVWMHYLQQQLNRDDDHFSAYPYAGTTYQKYREFKKKKNPISN